MNSSKIKRPYNIGVIQVIIASLLVPKVESASFDEVNSLHVWITVSSVARKDPNNIKGLLFRQIELNWINAPLEDVNDYIGLYLDGEPENNELPVSVHKLNGRLNGQITTDYYLPQLDYFNETKNLNTHEYHSQADHGGRIESQNDITLPSQHRAFAAEASEDQHVDNSDLRWRRYGTSRRAIAASPSLSHVARGAHDLAAKPSSMNKGLGSANSLVHDECVGYCLAYHSGDKILAKNCLKTNPTWMEEQFQQIGLRALPSIMIPGSHNSGTYPKLLDKSVLQMINKYQLNQDDNIFNQLMFGIRHLDLRVGYSKVKHHHERLWIYHDIFRTDVSLSEVVEQVKRFLDLTSHEIIVMDFHRFTVGFLNESPSVQRERHAKVIELLFEQLGNYIVPSYLGQHAPLQEYVAMGKRLLIGYADRQQLVAHLGDNAGAGGHSLFALYREQQHGSTSTNKKRQSAFTTESIPENGINSNNQESSVATTSDTSKQEAEPQTDRRMGTRIYNKLKSLKLISNSFSRRTSAPSTNGGEPTARATNDTREPLSSHYDQASMKLSTHHDDDNQHYQGPAPSSEDTINAQVNKAALLFQPVRHLWPNKDTIEGLAQYLNETACRKYFGELRSLMVELTPTVFGAISDKYDGNRKLAQRVNRPVTDWIRDRWLHCANIVASDYFLGNDLIRLAISANRMRLQHRSGGIDMNSYGGQCRSFKRIEHLLDKSKIPIQFTYQPYPSGNHNSRGAGPFGRPPTKSRDIDNNLITHTSSDGNKILLRPLISSLHQSSSSYFEPGAQSRERRDSFVDNVSEGFADIFSSFKRLLNLR